MPPIFHPINPIHHMSEEHRRRAFPDRNPTPPFWPKATEERFSPLDRLGDVSPLDRFKPRLPGTNWK